MRASVSSLGSDTGVHTDRQRPVDSSLTKSRHKSGMHLVEWAQLPELAKARSLFTLSTDVAKFKIVSICPKQIQIRICWKAFPKIKRYMTGLTQSVFPGVPETVEGFSLS